MTMIFGFFGDNSAEGFGDGEFFSSSAVFKSTSQGVTLGVASLINNEGNYGTNQSVTLGVASAASVESWVTLTPAVAIGIATTKSVESQITRTPAVAIGIASTKAVEAWLTDSQAVSIGVASSVSDASIEVQVDRDHGVTVAVDAADDLEAQLDERLQDVAVGVASATPLEAQLDDDQPVSIGVTSSVELEAHLHEVTEPTFVRSSVAVEQDGPYALWLPGNAANYAKATSIDFSGDEFTIEFIVQRLGGGTEVGLVSYATSTQSNEILLFSLTNMTVTIGAVAVSTGINTSDGEPHHIRVTWRKSDGLTQAFKDGVRAYSGTLRAGYTIGSGGILFLGQEQDSYGGTLDTNQALTGVMREVRFWDSMKGLDSINTGVGGPVGDTAGLRYWWPLDDGTGTTACDRGTGNRDLALTSLSWAQLSYETSTDEPRYRLVEREVGYDGLDHATNLIADSETLGNHGLVSYGGVTNLGSEVRDGEYHVHFSKTGYDYRLFSATYPIEKTQTYYYAVEYKLVQTPDAKFMVYSRGTAVDDTTYDEKLLFQVTGAGVFTGGANTELASLTDLGDGYFRIVVKVKPAYWSGTGDSIRFGVYNNWGVVGEYEYFYRKPRFVKDGGTRSMRLERGATNKMVVEGSGAHKDWSLWSHYNSSTYWVQATRKQYDHPTEGKVFYGEAARTGTFLYDYYPYDVVASTPYQIQVRVRLVNGTPNRTGTITGYINHVPAGSQVTIGSQAKTYTLTSEWQDLWFSVTPNATTNDAGIGINFNTVLQLGDEIEASRPQLVQKAFPLGWADSNRSDESLTVPTVGLVDPVAGKFRTKIKLNRSPGSERQYLFASNGFGGNNALIGYIETTGVLHLRIGSGTSLPFIAGTTVLQRDVAYEIEMEWGADFGRITLDGVEEAFSNQVNAATVGSTFWLYTFGGALQWLDGEVDWTELVYSDGTVRRLSFEQSLAYDDATHHQRPVVGVASDVSESSIEVFIDRSHDVSLGVVSDLDLVAELDELAQNVTLGVASTKSVESQITRAQGIVIGVAASRAIEAQLARAQSKVFSVASTTFPEITFVRDQDVAFGVSGIEDLVVPVKWPFGFDGDDDALGFGEGELQSSARLLTVTSDLDLAASFETAQDVSLGVSSGYVIGVEIDRDQAVTLGLASADDIVFETPLDSAVTLAVSSATSVESQLSRSQPVAVGVSASRSVEAWLTDSQAVSIGVASAPSVESQIDRDQPVAIDASSLLDLVAQLDELADSVSVGVASDSSVEAQLDDAQPVSIGVAASNSVEAWLTDASAVSIGVASASSVESQIARSQPVAIGVAASDSVEAWLTDSSAVSIGVASSVALEAQLTSLSQGVSVGVSSGSSLVVPVKFTFGFEGDDDSLGFGEGELASAARLITVSSDLDLSASFATSQDVSLGVSSANSVEAQLDKQQGVSLTVAALDDVVFETPLSSTVPIGVASAPSVEAWLTRSQAASIGVAASDSVEAWLTDAQAVSLGVASSQSIEVWIDRQHPVAVGVATADSLVASFTQSASVALGVASSVSLDAFLDTSQAVTFGIGSGFATEVPVKWAFGFDGDDDSLGFGEGELHSARSLLTVTSDVHLEASFATEQDIQLAVQQDHLLEVPLSSDQPVALAVASANDLEAQAATAQNVSLAVASAATVESWITRAHGVTLGVASSLFLDSSLATSQTVSIGVASASSVEAWLTDSQAVALGISSSLGLEASFATDQAVALGVASDVQLVVPLASSQPVSLGVASSNAITAEEADSDVIVIGVTSQVSVEAQLVRNQSVQLGVASDSWVSTDYGTAQTVLLGVASAISVQADRDSSGSVVLGVSSTVALSVVDVYHLELPWVRTHGLDSLDRLVAQLRTAERAEPTVSQEAIRYSTAARPAPELVVLTSHEADALRRLPGQFQGMARAVPATAQPGSLPTAVMEPSRDVLKALDHESSALSRLAGQFKSVERSAPTSAAVEAAFSVDPALPALVKMADHEAAALSRLPGQFRSVEVSTAVWIPATSLPASPVTEPSRDVSVETGHELVAVSRLAAQLRTAERSEPVQEAEDQAAGSTTPVPDVAKVVGHEAAALSRLGGQFHVVA